MDNPFSILIFVVIILLVSLYLADEFYNIAKLKGYDERKYFWTSFLLGAAGWLLVIALPNKNGSNHSTEDSIAYENNYSDDLPEL